MQAMIAGGTPRKLARAVTAAVLVGLGLAALPATSTAQDLTGYAAGDTVVGGKVRADTVRGPEPVQLSLERGDGGPNPWETLGWITVGEYVYGVTIDLVNLNQWQHDKDWSPGRALGYMTNPFGAPASDFGCLTRDGCWPTEASHYISWAVLGAGARLAGHGALEAWLLTGVYSNWLWEYGVEGMSQRPSGRDLLIDAVSAAAGIGLVELGKAVF